MIVRRRSFLQSCGRCAAMVPFAAGAGRVAAFWQQQPAPTVAQRRALIGKSPIVSTRLTDTLSLLSGPGGNVVVLDGADGKVVVDTFVNPAWGALKDALGRISAAPVKTVLDTHWHFDHADNNDSFRKEGAAVLAHANTSKRMSETHVVMGMEMTPVAREVLPTQTFTAKRVIDVSGERIEAAPIPPAHTDTDIYVHFTKGNVLHLGDVYFNGGYPFIDTSTGGNIDGQIAGATLGLTIGDSATRVVPGHGPISDKAALRNYRDMMVTVRDRVQKLKASGRTIDEVIAERPTADLDAAWSSFMTPAFFLRTVFETIK
jgi:glyoxylase-like metal-dependent hydrolase (beta-lactamase superfamily II)